MAELTITTDDVRIVELIEGDTAPASGALDAGMVVNQNTSGKWTKAYDHAATPNMDGLAVCARSASGANVPITAVRKGTLYLGDALDGLDINDPVYLATTTQGGMDDAAGTNSVLVGRVKAFWGDSTLLKVLRVDL